MRYLAILSINAFAFISCVNQRISENYTEPTPEDTVEVFSIQPDSLYKSDDEISHVDDISDDSSQADVNDSTHIISENYTEPSAENTVEELNMLPDTMYQSAAEINYAVDILGDSSQTNINDFTDIYASSSGVLTFRGGTLRQADFGGKVTGHPSSIIIDWRFDTDTDTTITAFGVWGGGTGWTGQPLYIEWPDSCVARFEQLGNITPDFGQKEIIIGSLSGHIYFINYDNGKESRKPIDVTNPIKGTPSLDPTLNGNLYVGHGIPKQRPFGTLTIDLYKHSVSQISDVDSTAWRRWGAFDSSPIRTGNFLIWPGENNTVYKFNVSQGELTLHSRLRYAINRYAPGIESSMCIYQNYGYTCDNHGNIICINLNTLKPVWLYKLYDDIDATPVLEIEDDKPYLYVGCEIDLQGCGIAGFVKLDALNGDEIWLTCFEGNRVEYYGKHFDGGFYASALPGQGNCSHLIFSNCVRNTSGQNGELIAFNKYNGEIEYTVPLNHYSWSSPVGFMNEDDEMFILTADTKGYLYLINGISGDIITSRKVGRNFESSPVVSGNSAVIGSRGKRIYKISIK